MANSNSILNTLLSSGSLSALSDLSGAGKDQVQKVLSEAVPTLVKRMKNNAATEDGEKSLSTALSSHAKDDTSDISSFLKNVDLEDGGKILTHILGGNKTKVESGIADKSGLSSNQTTTILAAAAPLLLSLLGNKKDEEDGNEQSGGLMGMFSSLFGGGDDDEKEEKDDGFGLDDVASMLLGGDKENKKDDIGDMLMGGLGSLLGNDKKKSAAKKPASTKKKTTTKKKATVKKKTTKKK